MFETYYEFYHYLLSCFSPHDSVDIKQLLDEALYWYNSKNTSKFMGLLRSIQYHLASIGKTTEANTTQNYIQYLLWKNKQGGAIMARCYYLDYKSNSLFGNSKDRYYCKLCGQEFKVDDPRVRFTCNADCGEKYKECPIYKSKR